MRGQQPSGQGVAVRKSAKRRERVTASAPMLIMRGMVSDQLEIRERMAVQAFSGGWATIREFDVLADMQGVLLLAGTTSKGRQPAAKWAKDVLGKTPRILTSGYQAPPFYDGMWKAIQEEEHWSGEIWNRHKNGGVYAEMLSIATVLDADGALQNRSAHR